MTRDEMDQAMGQLRQSVIRGLPAVLQEWLGGVRADVERLTKAAVNPDVSEAEFLAMVESFADNAPDLVLKMQPDALADYLERAMGTALALGYGSRQDNGR